MLRRHGRPILFAAAALLGLAPAFVAPQRRAPSPIPRRYSSDARSEVADLSEFQEEWYSATVSGHHSQGLICDLSDDNGQPAQGVVRLSEIRDTPTTVNQMKRNFGKGQYIRVRVKDMQNGMLDLSMREWQPDEIDYAAFKEHPSEKPLSGTVLRVVSFGLMVQVRKPFGVGFVQKSKLPKKSYIAGETVSVWVVGVDEEGETLSFSMEPQGFDVFLNMDPDAEIDAEVVTTMDYGVFLRTVGEHKADGLLHMTEVPGVFSQEAFPKGEVRKVRLKSVDKEKKRLSFTLMPRVDYQKLQDAPREWVTGVVRKQTKTGYLVEAFVAGQGVQGVLPSRSEMEIGQTVELRIYQVYPEQERVRFQARDWYEGRDRSEGKERSEAKEEAKEEVKEETSEARGKERVPKEAAQVLSKYKQRLRDMGYDSVGLLKKLCREEWAQMQKSCEMLPGDAAKLRVALLPDGWAF